MHICLKLSNPQLSGLIFYLDIHSSSNLKFQSYKSVRNPEIILPSKVKELGILNRTMLSWIAKKI